MPTFAYQAVDAAGKRSKGVSAASSSAALTRTLEESGLMVLEVAESKAEAGAKKKSFGFGSHRREVLEFTRAMGSLLPVGMPLATALSAASGVCTGEVQAAVTDIKERVERGNTISSALTEHPRFFSPLYIGLVRAGERSGDLDQSFSRLAVQLEKDEAMSAKITSAMIYPIILAVAGTGAVLVLMLLVIPKFVDLLKGNGSQLPASTAAVMAISGFLRHFWYVLALIPVGIAFFVSWVKRTDEGKRFMAKVMLAVPAMRTLRQYSLAGRFARLMGVLLGGGAPLLTALDDTVDSTTDPIAKDDVIRVRARVREGISLRAAVAEGGLHPPLLAQLIGVGEDAGELKIFLLKAAEIFEERTERATQRVSTLAEPVMILIFGGIVAFVALSLLQAIYGINASAMK